jgi:hypothetical protein
MQPKFLAFFECIKQLPNTEQRNYVASNSRILWFQLYLPMSAFMLAKVH